MSSNIYQHAKLMFVVRAQEKSDASNFARELEKYFTTPNESRFYYSRNDGPAHLIVIDTGEDKPDSTNVYAH